MSKFTDKDFTKNHIILLKPKRYLFIFPKQNVYAFQVLESGFISASSLEASRRVIVRLIRGFGKLRIVLKPFFWLTAKPNDVRMGKGKGDKSTLVLPVKAGAILFEISGVSFDLLNIILKQVSYKLSLRIKLLFKT